MLKQEKGVSLMQMVVTIILIILIASFAIWYASNTTNEAKLTKIYSEITAVKSAYENALALNELNSTNYPIFDNEVTEGKEKILETTSVDYLQSNYSNEEVNFVYLLSNSDTLFIVNSSNSKKIELEKIDYEYVIDMDTDEVFIIGGFARNDYNVKVYEYSDIVKLYNSVFK